MLMKNLLLFSLFFSISMNGLATIHKIIVWDGYLKFITEAGDPANIEINLGDTVNWLPISGAPAMAHTVTSASIPVGAASFDYTWQAPADTFFQYIPTVVGLHEFECTPHVLDGMIGSINVISATVSAPENELSYSVYPNPCSDFIIVKGLGKGEKWTMTDINGKTISSGQYADQIQVRDIEKGVYFLHFYEEKRSVLRFMKE